ncbi:MAG: hypothetical protein MHM6MM_000188 [Cercozoa sp. M6MM]
MTDLNDIIPPPPEVDAPPVVPPPPLPSDADISSDAQNSNSGTPQRTEQDWQDFAKRTNRRIARLEMTVAALRRVVEQQLNIRVFMDENGVVTSAAIGAGVEQEKRQAPASNRRRNRPRTSTVGGEEGAIFRSMRDDDTSVPVMPPMSGVTVVGSEESSLADAVSNEQAKQKRALLDKIRGKVSKKKNRFQEDGFDLDLTYVTEQIIAMGFPADSLEGLYRNNFRDVQRFFGSRHCSADGTPHYRVYNLCSERDYPDNRFEGRVMRFPFDDHNPCPFKMLPLFCRDVYQWCSRDRDNVAAIHCKAGKGRTGLMITCYLQYEGLASTPQEALEYYAQMRTQDGQGVTIPSQRRYTHYFGTFLRRERERLGLPADAVVPLDDIESNARSEPIVGASNIRLLKRVFIRHMDLKGGECSFRLRIGNRKFSSKVHSDKYTQVEATHSHSYECGNKIPLPDEVDVKCEIYKEKAFNKEKICHFWFNTGFLEDNKLVLQKLEIDKLHKDKKHKLFPADMSIELEFEDFHSASVQRAWSAVRCAL